MKRPLLAQDGRTVLHPSITLNGARAWLMKNVDVTLVKRHGFTLNVWEREPWIAELNGGPIGFMYSIGK